MQEKIFFLFSLVVRWWLHSTSNKVALFSSQWRIQVFKEAGMPVWEPKFWRSKNFWQHISRGFGVMSIFWNFLARQSQEVTDYSSLIHNKSLFNRNFQFFNLFHNFLVITFFSKWWRHENTTWCILLIFQSFQFLDVPQWFWEMILCL